MHPGHPQVEHESGLHRALLVAALLMIGLVGCASEPTPKASHLPEDTAPYVGVFTGEFVDGMPLYRLPTIEVIGRRNGLGPGI